MLPDEAHSCTACTCVQFACRLPPQQLHSLAAYHTLLSRHCVRQSARWGALMLCNTSLLIMACMSYHCVTDKPPNPCCRAVPVDWQKAAICCSSAHNIARHQKHMITALSEGSVIAQYEFITPHGTLNFKLPKGDKVSGYWYAGKLANYQSFVPAGSSKAPAQPQQGQQSATSGYTLRVSLYLPRELLQDSCEMVEQLAEQDALDDPEQAKGKAKPKYSGRVSGCPDGHNCLASTLVG